MSLPSPVMAGRQSRPPKHAEPAVAVPSTATHRTVFMGRRDLRPAMTDVWGSVGGLAQ